MATYRELLKGVKSRIREVDVRELEASRNGAGKPVLIDVREQDEVEQGIIPGAIHVPRELTPVQQKRYSRHVLIPEVGKEGQLNLLDSKVLIIGAGGLGSPAAYYLAAAGV